MNQQTMPAQAIPSMGGRQLADFLYGAARELRGTGSVVECGSWLGASIAPVAAGLRDAKSTAVIHCYDRWRANREEVRKAEAVMRLTLVVVFVLCAAQSSYCVLTKEPLPPSNARQTPVTSGVPAVDHDQARVWLKASILGPVVYKQH